MYIGVDIGGTKCSCVLGDKEAKILKKIKFETLAKDETIAKIVVSIEELMQPQVMAIGISCGGPLNSKQGIILSPPNLPGWDQVEIVKMIQEKFNKPTFLQNDADACAIAEWKFGSGKGYDNLIFLTFGTGMGAGLILNGRLYTGNSNMAGEVGHIRLYDTGHTGYGKSGSFEGYCSGAGIAQYGYGSAKDLALLAREGDLKAIQIYEEVGKNLAKGLAVLIDILNPDVIVIGSIFIRARDLMEKSMYDMLKHEALTQSLTNVKILPAKLQEDLGDIAALCVAINGSEQAGGSSNE
jgi:glucokinase